MTADGKSSTERNGIGTDKYGGKYSRLYSHTQIFVSLWMCKQMSYIHMIEKYSFRKRSEVLIHATTWMNLKTACYMKESAWKDYILCDHIIYHGYITVTDYIITMGQCEL